MRKWYVAGAALLAVLGTGVCWCVERGYRHPGSSLVTVLQAAQVGLQTGPFRPVSGRGGRAEAPTHCQKSCAHQGTNAPLEHHGLDPVAHGRDEQVPAAALCPPNQCEPAEVIQIDRIDPRVAQAIRDALGVEQRLYHVDESDGGERGEVIVNRFEESTPPARCGARESCRPASRESDACAYMPYAHEPLGECPGRCPGEQAKMPRAGGPGLGDADPLPVLEQVNYEEAAGDTPSQGESADTKEESARPTEPVYEGYRHHPGCPYLHGCPYQTRYPMDHRADPVPPAESDPAAPAPPEREDTSSGSRRVLSSPDDELRQPFLDTLEFRPGEDGVVSLEGMIF